jgi:hypothetical protein
MFASFYWKRWILQKVVLNMSIFGACRCDELCKYDELLLVIIFNKQILFHKIEFQLYMNERKRVSES